MPHDRLFEPTSTITRFDIKAGIRRAHKLRSEAVGNMFKTVFGRRKRKPAISPDANRATC
ncbi:MAG: hypothetical protein VW338_16730 [Rhodospirillaceae bacterium]